LLLKVSKKGQSTMLKVHPSWGCGLHLSETRLTNVPNHLLVRGLKINLVDGEAQGSAEK